MIKFSIIVPIYNVEEYLLDCLNSIKCQSNKNYECILVNDGSTDRSPEIAKKFAIENQNFLYFEKNNGGLSDARNYGLDKANGEFIIFIDSDDFVNIKLLSVLEYILSQNDNIDLILISYKRFNDGESINFYPNLDCNNIKFSHISKRELLQQSNFAWARIVRKSFYNNNLFPKGYIYEDAVTSPVLAYNSDVIVKIEMPLYFYRKRASSITTSSAEKQFQLLDTMLVLKERCKNHNIPSSYYHTTFVNLTKSIVISLARLDNRYSFITYLSRSWVSYEDLSLNEGLTTYSKFIFKLLFMILKLKWLGVPFYLLLKLLLIFLRK